MRSSLEYSVSKVAFITGANVVTILLNLINPIELDFGDDKEFSNKFYVITNDEPKARLLMTPSFRNCIKSIESKDFLIEIIDNRLIIGNKKNIETATVLEFVKFMDILSKKN